MEGFVNEKVCDIHIPIQEPILESECVYRYEGKTYLISPNPKRLGKIFLNSFTTTLTELEKCLKKISTSPKT